MKKYLYFIARCAGVFGFFYWLNQDRQIILVYHNVLPDHLIPKVRDFGLSIGESRFKRQLEVVRRRFELTTELGKPNSCILTFDDGYRNFFTTILPALEECHIKAYFFVPLGVITDGEMIWVDRILLWVAYVPEISFNIFERNFFLNNEKSRTECKNHILLSIQREYGRKQHVVSMLDAVYPFSKLKVPGQVFDSRYAVLLKSDVDAIKRRGHLIGSHSINHDMLGKLGANELDAEFAHCLRHVGTVYNTSIFSYPFGTPREVSQNVVESCKKSGFSAACLNQDAYQGRSEFELARTNISHAVSSSEIEAHLCGFIPFLKRMKRVFCKDKLSLGLFERRTRCTF